jgi:vancomycin permeability regulator SanA
MTGSTTRIRPQYRWIVATAVLVPTIVAGPYLFLRFATIGDIVGPDGTPRHADAALVLGAKVGDDGLPSVFLQERVDAGVDLWERGIVDVLVMSGATRPDGYDEPATMRDLALHQGVPASAIVLDRSGVDTFASCANAAGPLGLRSVVVVTQQFHVPRATWLCQQAGLDAQGYYPPIGRRAGTVTGNVREIAADWKAVLNVWTGRGASAEGSE